MKKIILLLLTLINVFCLSNAQNQTVLNTLKSNYDEVETYLESKKFYILKKGEYQGVADINGEIIIPVEYSNVSYQEDEKVFFVTKGGYKENYQIWGGKWGMTDNKGNWLTPIKYARLFTFSTYKNGYQPVNEGGVSNDISNNTKFEGGKEGLLHYTGKEAIPCIYDFVNPWVAEGVTSVNLGGKRDETGKLIGGKWGFVDLETGKVVVPIEYEKVQAFQDGVARVTKNGQTTLIKNPLKEGNAIALSQVSSVKKDPNAPAISRYPAPNSDVDKDIPTIKTHINTNQFAFIIANENYPEAPVPYALNDGRIFKEYCKKTLGLPDKNIKMFEDASLGRIIAVVEQIKEIANAYDGDAEVIIYYAGHGVPDDKMNTAYLLPVDGSSSDIIHTGYSLEKLYTELGKLDLKSVTVFLDACFSGAKREDEMLASARGVAIKVKDEAPKGNMVVFSAATGDETAHQYEEMGHGLFTYFLLKKLQETQGNVTYAELSDYVNKQVKRQSVVINNKRQTPTVIPSVSMGENWKTKKLK